MFTDKKSLLLTEAPTVKPEAEEHSSEKKLSELGLVLLWGSPWPWWYFQNY